jgi:hypothetical protein
MYPRQRIKCATKTESENLPDAHEYHHNIAVQCSRQKEKRKGKAKEIPKFYAFFWAYASTLCQLRRIPVSMRKEKKKRKKDKRKKEVS